jgi:hypothetical protein
MPKSWNLFVQTQEGLPFVHRDSRPSGDACKTAARAIHLGPFGATARYRIFDPSGVLWQVSGPGNGDRMKWRWATDEDRKDVWPD